MYIYLDDPVGETLIDSFLLLRYSSLALLSVLSTLYLLAVGVSFLYFYFGKTLLC